MFSNVGAVLIENLVDSLFSRPRSSKNLRSIFLLLFPLRFFLGVASSMVP